MIQETDVELPNGRTLHVYDTGGPADLTVYWHSGTPQIGLPPIEAAPQIRWIAHDRPAYGGSTAVQGRTIASAAADTAAVADALGLDRFAVMGSSGGGPPALACAALLSDRVPAVACLAGIAPYGVAGLDWFAGMAPSGTVELRAAVAGEAELRTHLAAAANEQPDWLTAADIAMFSGPLGPWLIKSSTDGMASGPDGFVADDLATVGEWGFAVAEVKVPALLLHGDNDHCVPYAHGEWLAGQIKGSELRGYPGESHISVLKNIDQAVDWLRKHA